MLRYDSAVWEGSADIYASGATIETVEDFCYLGSYISTTGNCDKEVNVRIGKAAGIRQIMEEQEHQFVSEYKAL